ncbi:MAG TPA: DUF3343 domain-containing protein [Candidatus Eremiobacteraeota bacterium]|nr:MAG: hypothetical protein BWY64_03292 [bacterium ADurb.Bin363]HPZ07233.1 DUF3343 domain-containing protein [Candidatus Eremiobacteraeota bacterium]
MSKCVALFKSIHEVLKIEELLNNSGIFCDIIPLPRDVSKSCGMGVVFLCRDVEKVKETGERNNLKINYIYTLKEGQFDLLL